MKHRQATRRTFVVESRIQHTKPGDPFHPANLYPEKADCEMWTVWITTRSGLLPNRISWQTFFAEEEAQEFVQSNPAGKELNANLTADPAFFGSLRHQLRNFMDTNPRSLGVGNAGDEESPLAFDVLDEAGITKGMGLSDEVLKSFETERIDALKDMYGDNWRSAASFEYCWLHLPHSSPAYVASAYQFHYYITNDEFSAGYLWRDLECLVYGVETAAVNALEMRKKAGAAGSQKSARARNARRAALLEAMEVLAQRNPDMTKVPASILSMVALNECKSANPPLWRQGEGQISEYLGEIRRGEAGPELKRRFLALFPEKPPKR